MKFLVCTKLNNFMKNFCIAKRISNSLLKGVFVSIGFLQKKNKVHDIKKKFCNAALD